MFRRFAIQCSGTLAALMVLTCAAALSAAQAPALALEQSDPPKPVPEFQFSDGKGEFRTISEFRGNVVLLNLWATWCGPCRHEMPTLDSLQKQLLDTGFNVIALSIEDVETEVIDRFYEENEVKNLSVYIDRSGGVTRVLEATGLPTTLLIDKEGREVGRILGSAVWDTPKMIKLFRRHQGPALK